MSNRTGMKAPSARQMCGRCRTVVTRYVEAVEEPETRKLYHPRCWRREEKERKRADRALLREVLREPTAAEEAIDELQTWVGRGLAAQKAVDEIVTREFPARLVYPTPKPAKPPKVPRPLHQLPQEPLTAPEGAITPTRARNGVRRAVAHFIGSQPSGQWWHMQQVAEHVTRQGISTTFGTIQATVSELVRTRGMERFRVGNLRAYRAVPSPDGGRIEEAVIPENPVPRIEPPTSEERAARAIDRAMNDLSALIGELIAETRRELRKELGAL